MAAPIWYYESNVTIAEIADVIQMTEHRQGPVVIGVDGFCGAGKTVFAQRLQRLLPDASVVQLDDFVDRSKMPAASWDDGVFDRGRLEREVLYPITHGGQAQYESLQWDEGTLGATHGVDGRTYLIVEGTTALHPDVCHYYDYQIWVQASAQTAVARGRRRDRLAGLANDGLWESWSRNDTQYLSKYHPEERADCIFDNDGAALAPTIDPVDG